MNTNKLVAITCKENKHFVIQLKFKHYNARKTYGIANSSSEEFEPGVSLSFSQQVAIDLSVWSTFVYSSSYNIGRRLICVWRKPVFGWYPIKTQLNEQIIPTTSSHTQSQYKRTSRNIYLHPSSSCQSFLLCTKLTLLSLVCALSLWRFPWSSEKHK